MRSEENIKQLLQLLKIAYLERDEARGQLQSLLNNGLPSPVSPPVKNHQTSPHAQPVSLSPEITKANSCFKKFDDLSRAYSSHSCCPSQLDCLLDPILPDQDLDEAERFLQELPIVPGIGFWKALLWGCRIHSNMELGELAARKILALDPEDVSSYVMLSNAHSAAGRWQSVSMIRKEEFRVAVGLKSETSFISLLQGTETMNNTIRFIRSWDFCLPTFEFEGESVILWVKRI